MLQELIGRERDLFLAMQDKLEDLLQEERAYLQKQADAGKLSDRLIDRKNYELSVRADAIEAGDRYDNAIQYLLPQLEANRREIGQLKARLNRVDEENRAMKALMRSYALDTSILPYIREKDYDFVEYDHRRALRIREELTKTNSDPWESNRSRKTETLKQSLSKAMPRR